MYKVIGHTKTRTFRVLWMLQELGQPYTQIPAAAASTEAFEYNPLGKVPALVDGQDILTDSVAIMTYLADKHGGLTYPAGTAGRAKQDATTLWLIDEMDALLWNAAKHARIYPEEIRVPEVPGAMAADFGRSLEAFEARLGNSPFLMGDDITLPDILAGHCISWGFIAKFPKAPDAVLAYNKRLRERPAYKAAAGR